LKRGPQGAYEFRPLRFLIGVLLQPEVAVVSGDRPQSRAAESIGPGFNVREFGYRTDKPYIIASWGTESLLLMTSEMSTHDDVSSEALDLSPFLAQKS
jgi:hypothetical protein